jgi:hypothetical protein
MDIEKVPVKKICGGRLAFYSSGKEFSISNRLIPTIALSHYKTDFHQDVDLYFYHKKLIPGRKTY